MIVKLGTKEGVKVFDAFFVLTETDNGAPVALSVDFADGVFHIQAGDEGFEAALKQFGVQASKVVPV
jgi:hypothetical protein